jgi:uncharacterized membrane protein
MDCLLLRVPTFLLASRLIVITNSVRMTGNRKLFRIRRLGVEVATSLSTCLCSGVFGK